MRLGSFSGLALLCIISEPIQALLGDDLVRCYEDLGCFEATGQFFGFLRPPLLPNTPYMINTTFRLYTRKDPTFPQILNYTGEFDLNAIDIDYSLDTKILIHGYNEKEADWLLVMKDALLEKEQMNVITVDWENGAKGPFPYAFYPLAAVNSRVVGVQTGRLIERLQKAGLELSKVHIIGFSLGSHVAGYAGEVLKGNIRRITGMDPAGPFFAGLPPAVRLDKTDAQFVDVIHTDAKFLLGLGSKMNFGHVDFYPNGGHHQPGCLPTLVGYLLDLIPIDITKAVINNGGCRHRLSRLLYLDTILNGTMVGFPCEDYRTFLKGQCASCGQNGELCAVMGLMAEQLKTRNWMAGGVRLYLKTAEKKPYLLYHYQIIINTSKDDSHTGSIFDLIFGKPISFGIISVRLNGESAHSVAKDLNTEAQEFGSGGKYYFLFTTEENLGEIESLNLEYKPSSIQNNLYNLKWNVEGDLKVQSVVLTDMNQLFEKYIQQNGSQETDVKRNYILQQ